MIVRYVRISSRKKHERAVSPDRQRRETEELATHLGYADTVLLQDLGRSGGSITRSGWLETLRLISTGQCKVLITYSQDRLFRDLDAAHRFRRLAAKMGVTVVTCTEGELDLTSSDGGLVYNIKASVAQHYREYVTERTQRAMDDLREQGRKLGGHAPYGWDVDSQGQLVPNTQEQAVVARIMRLREQGVTWDGIVRVLDDERVPTKTGARGGWQPTTLKRIVRRLNGRAS